MQQAVCSVCEDLLLDLNEDRQVTLQKSSIVPLVSTAAMMRSRGCDIALKDGEIR